MKKSLLTGLILSFAISGLAGTDSISGRPDSELWLPSENRKVKVEYNHKTKDITLKKIAEILSEKAPDDYFKTIKLSLKKNDKISDEGYILQVDSLQRKATITASTEKGLMYGALSLYRPNSFADREDSPKNDLRILNHWDNADGTIERGYAGRSIWNWNTPLTQSQRNDYEKYGLANAMVGINGTVVNNVNASPKMLTRTYLKRLAEIASILRPYGLRTFLSVNFASPMALDSLPTADPLDGNVAQWWTDKVKEIYELIPDFGGFLVKANSEGQPGPCDFGRTHAEGANMLARALKPYNGIVMWRAFVYSPSDPDRAKQAYAEFHPLDGKFDDNVMVQVKNGPVDFQPREPYSPLFDGIEATPLIAELQITQEYLGHSNHLAYLAPMWEEFFKEAGPERIKGVAGVANIGDSSNMTGHPLAQANWYAFGRIAWDPDLKSEDIVKEWAGMVSWLNLEGQNLESFSQMMMQSRENVVDYMMPMGLHHLFAYGHHYGPEPWCEVAGARQDWLPKYYHNADNKGIGFDRTQASGSGATAQYRQDFQKIVENPSTCPEKYLLWFHKLPWDYEFATGETVWEGLNRHYDAGVEGVAEMRRIWTRLEGDVDEELFQDISDRLLTQHKDAIWWRDGCLEYFGEVGNQTPVNPSLHKLSTLKKVNLGIDNYTCPSSELLDKKR